MFILRKYIVITFVSLSVAMALTSCSETKIAQCKRLIQTVNEGTASLDAKKGSQVSTSLELAKELEGVSNKLKGTQYKDEKLEKYKTQYAEIFANLSQKIDKAAKGLGATKKAESSAGGREKIQKAKADMDDALKSATDAAKKLDGVVPELNKYCSQAE
jgi:ribosome-associated translation inhibitor RaiA